jgi:PAS domain S-box-containing protein
MGLLLQAPADLAPSAKDPFLIVDGSLTICALSRAAERLLGVSETEAINRHVGEFLAPGDAEAPTGENLSALLAWAARGESPATSVVVRPTNKFGVRYWARVGPCGPPQAALLVLADAR